MERIRSRAKTKLWRGTEGYTIAEVMIFLAISGGLLVAVMGSISGQQERTQFVTGTRDFETKLQDIVNDVEAGYYPNNGSTSCTDDPTGALDITIDPATGAPQGTNENCIFLGKTLQFYNTGPTPTNFVNYRATTVAGKRQSDSKDVTSLELAKPQAFNALGNGTDEGVLTNGLQFTTVKYYQLSPFSVRDSKGVAVLYNISSNSGVGGSISTAGGKPRLAFIDPQPDGGSIDATIRTLTTPSFDNIDGVVFCLSGGAGGNRVAAVTLGIRLSGLPAPADVQSTGQTLSTQTYFDDEARKFGCNE